MARPKYITDWKDVPVVFDLGYIAIILGVCPETARRLVSSGKIKGVKIEKQWRITKESLREYLGIDFFDEVR